jgi:hypothetical protein
MKVIRDKEDKTRRAAVIASALTGPLGIAAWYIQTKSIPWAMTFTWLAIVSFAVAIVNIFDAIAYSAIARYREKREADSITPATRFVEAHGGLSERAAQAVERSALLPMIDLISSNKFPIFQMKTPGQQVQSVPMEFIASYIGMGIEDGHPTQLKAIRTWRQGSREYNWAHALASEHGHFINLGIAMPPRSNLPARFVIPLSQVMTVTGLEHLGMIPDQYFKYEAQNKQVANHEDE